MKINPKSEINYRIKLAKNYLKDAEKAYKRRDYRGTVASSQLSAENAAKAIIAFFRIPSWSHDPSHELRELINNIPIKVRKPVEELAVIVENLAPEHGRTTYGEPTRGLTPWEIYSRKDAKKVLNYAKKAFKYAYNTLKELELL